MIQQLNSLLYLNNILYQVTYVTASLSTRNFLLFHNKSGSF